MDEEKRKKELRRAMDFRLAALATRRAKIWERLMNDFDADEDHAWRAEQHKELVVIETELDIIDKMAEQGLI